MVLEVVYGHGSRQIHRPGAVAAAIAMADGQDVVRLLHFQWPPSLNTNKNATLFANTHFMSIFSRPQHNN